MVKVVSWEEIVERVKLHHGDKYILHPETYEGVTKRMLITCPQQGHGDFRRIPNEFCPANKRKRKAKGCGPCGLKSRSIKRRIKDNELRQRCVDTHDKRFDYSKTDFSVGVGNQTNADSLVWIRCIKHSNEFQKTLYDHLRYKNGGCEICDREWMSEWQRMSVDEFIQRAAEKHEGKYNYDLVHEFANQHELVWINCPIEEHGFFPKSPANHLHLTRPQGCPICGAMHGGEKKRSNSSEFIEKAQAKHGKKYDYSAVDYIKSDEQVEIICPEHGSFPQTPNDHLSGHGCDKCGLIAQGAANKYLTTELVVERCKEVWGNRYDYSLVEWIHDSEKIQVICPINDHGIFPTDFHNHTSKIEPKGCPKCGSTRRVKQNAWLDSLDIPDNPQNREFRIKFNDGTWVFADGYVPDTNTVYEFWGDKWHGNPKFYQPKEIFFGITMADRFLTTQKKRRNYTAHGYKLVEIWENEWDKEQS